MKLVKKTVKNYVVLSNLYPTFLNPHYSYKNAVNYMNQRWTKGRDAGNPPDKSRDRQKYPKFG